MKTAQEFYNKVVGKGFDIDGAYGAQCWDLFAYFCKEAGYPIFNCTTTGFVKDIYNNRKTNGILKYFDDVPVMQRGDWCIWGNCEACPDSHIAMYWADIDGNYAWFLGQNQLPGNQAASLVKLPIKGNLGALRPKCYVVQAKPANKCPYKASGAVKAAFNGIRVRTAASTKKGDTGIVYDAGMTLNYDTIVEADGWYWAKYKRSNGGIGYCALCKSDGTNKYWKQA